MRTPVCTAGGTPFVEGLALQNAGALVQAIDVEAKAKELAVLRLQK